MSDRRGFLRGLATLPLIGGSVALIGSPTQAAVPRTPELKARYIAWLANEHAAALYERDGMGSASWHDDRMLTDWSYARAWMPMFDFGAAPDIERMTAWSKPSTRAAVILSAAGVPLG